jgi:hypothetical protein
VLKIKSSKDVKDCICFTEKKEKPDCFIPNKYAYPLCKGKDKQQCKHCCLYEDMAEVYDYD